MFWQEEIQFVMYMCTNSVGRSTAVVSRFTTSIEWRLISIFTSTEKNLDLQNKGDFILRKKNKWRKQSKGYKINSTQTNLIYRQVKSKMRDHMTPAKRK